MIKSFLKIFVILILLNGCGYINGLFSYKVLLEKVSILVDKNVNDNSAVALDLVVVCDESLNSEIGKMTAEEYFHRKSDLVAINADKILVWHWEVVPVQKLVNLPINFDEFDPINGYVFAYYANDKVNRVKIPDVQEIKIVLSKDRVRIVKVASEDN